MEPNPNNDIPVRIDMRALALESLDRAFRHITLAAMPDEVRGDVGRILTVFKKHGIDTIEALQLMNELVQALKQKDGADDGE